METFSDYSDYTEKRAESLQDKQIYLQGKTCPAGARPCDPSKRECPDDEYALEPAIYTADGFRCYSNVNMDKPRDPEEIKDQHVKIMEFVESAAKLTASIKGKLDKLRCSDITQENMCGMKNTCNWANGLCSHKPQPFIGPREFNCGDYLKDECVKYDKCAWDDDVNVCTSVTTPKPV